MGLKAWTLNESTEPAFSHRAMDEPRLSRKGRFFHMDDAAPRVKYRPVAQSDNFLDNFSTDPRPVEDLR